jgi:uncharacterized protein (TIGR02300 family)
VAKPELGTKRACPTTGRKFYDLSRDPIVSPYTGQSYPRSFFDPQSKFLDSDNDDELDVVGGSAVVSLDEVAASEIIADPLADTDIDLEDDGISTDDTFLEEEDDDDGDVSGLIDGDIETDDEI